MVDIYENLRYGICEGCRSLEVAIDKTRYRYTCNPKKDTTICPCSDCLLKTICKTECDKLNVYFHLKPKGFLYG